MTRWQQAACVLVVVTIAVGYQTTYSQQRDVLDVLLGDTQIQYNRGRHVAPIYEGWFRNPDGTIDMWFGYLNLNWEETLHVPVGVNNRIEPGGPDQGQPAVFVPRRRTGSAYSRREASVFRVRLPSSWNQDDELVWTVTAHGTTDRAVGLLLPVYELSPPADGNRAPTVRLQTSSARVSLSNTVTLSATVSDDGKPEDGRDRANVRWVHYRGPGRVTFDPALLPLPADTPPGTDVEATTTAAFSEPGIYVLRAEANDGTVNRGGDPIVPSTTHALATVEVTSRSAQRP